MVGWKGRLEQGARTRAGARIGRVCMCMPISIARKAINRTPNIGIAGAIPSTLTVDEEWEELARALLKQG